LCWPRRNRIRVGWCNQDSRLFRCWSSAGPGSTHSGQYEPFHRLQRRSTTYSLRNCGVEEIRWRASPCYDPVSDNRFIYVISSLIIHRSNGFAGSIAGAVLEAPSEELKIVATDIPDSVPMMFVVSGKSQEALLQYLNNYLDFCLDADASLFHSICYTSCVGREHYRYRFACVATNMQDLIARLEERIRIGLPVSVGNARRILMGFPGQGSQYQGMGRYLAQQYSGFNAIITDAANKASALTGYPILPLLVDQSAPRGLSIDQSEVAQVCIFIFQYSVCTWLESLGIHAHAVMGHSLGEIAAAGMFSSRVTGSLLTGLISNCSSFQFRGRFAICGR
jgi:Acyl transferase domain